VQSNIFLEVFFSKTPASPKRPPAERHRRAQWTNCAHRTLSGPVMDWTERQ
jgi:hypothetical protein